MLSRRMLLKKTLTLTAMLQTPVFRSLMAMPRRPSFSIGACDWSIGKASQIGAFEVAREIGLDGIMVDMGAAENNLHIRQKDMQQAYLAASAASGIAITSLAMGVYNRIPFHSDSRTEEWVAGAIDATHNLGVQVLLLAFFNASDLRNDRDRQKTAIDILKKLTPYAERKGVILGIESYLNAEEHMQIIDGVGSSSLKVYYDFRNTQDAGHDAIAEFKKLKKEMICELHMKENGTLLENGTLDWTAIRDAIYETGYTGNRWMQIEGAVPRGAEIVASYRKNLSYLRSLFS